MDSHRELNTPRFSPTATLLSNGEVLVAGGSDYGAVATTELYDPGIGVTPTPTPTASPTPAPTATATPTPTATPTVTPTPTPTVTPIPTPTPGKIHGRGSVDNQGNEVTFKFLASQAGDGITLGQFRFCDPAAGMCTTNAKVQSLSITGNIASFSGQARLEDGNRITFSVSVTDNGWPGTSDTISISLSNGYSVSGNLTSGNIRIQ